MSLNKQMLLFIFIYFINTYAFALEAGIKSNDGLFQLTGDNGALVTSSYVGWLNGWKWDDPKVSQISKKNNKKEFFLEFRKQGVKSKIEIGNEQSGIKYVYHHQFNKTLQDTIGGGIEFNLDLSSQIRDSGAKEPKLLSNNQGWSWELEPGKTIFVKFSPAVAKVYFERGNKSKIRTLFFSGELSSGDSLNTTMQISIPKGSSIAPLADNDLIKKQSTWFDGVLNPDKSFIDLSELNEKPAGQYGFIKARGDSLVFDDGKPVRFFGTNVQAYTLFINDKQKIKQHAKRISRLGFNLVRLHHHDSIWLTPSLIQQGNTTQQINTQALDSYFWWIKCLRDEGIYVWVDLQVQRPWREGDQISGWETDMAPKAKNGMNVGKGFIYLNKRMQELTKKFNEELLTRINPYTQLALINDPAVMGMMITNENDITHHFGNAFLKDKNHPYHQFLFDEEVKIFANKFGLPAYKVRETWKPGASKYLLNDIEARFNKSMIKHLRDLGVKVPITTTSLWGRNTALYSLPALTVGDMVDAHGYADSGIFNKRQLQKKPQFDPYFLHLIGQGQVVDKPFTVTEYNVEEGSDLDNAYIPAISVASMAAFQGWDAIMLYGYSQDALKGGRASPWSSYTHPAIMGVIPAMALLYREGHVAPAKKTVILAPVNDTLFNKNLSPKTSVTMRTTLEQHRMVIAMPKTKILPWLPPSRIDKNAIVIHDFNKNMLPANQNFIVSDTGEVNRDWSKGIMTINTAKSQLVMGRIGGRIVKLNDVIVKARTPEAAIIFTSLDKNPIRTSKRIMVSVVAKVAKVKHKWKSSYISEPVNAEITFSSVHKGLRLVALLSDGSEGRSLSLKMNSNGEYSFILSEKDNTHWYIITQ